MFQLQFLKNGSGGSGFTFAFGSLKTPGIVRCAKLLSIVAGPGYQTMGMNGGSSPSYLACTPCVPLFCTLFKKGVETEGLLDGDHVHCTVEPPPSHIRFRDYQGRKNNINWERKKPINIKNFSGTPPGVRPVCPGDTSRLSRDMSRLSRGRSVPVVLIYT